MSAADLVPRAFLHSPDIRVFTDEAPAGYFSMRDG
jgi:hypothetical protein